MSLRIRRLFRLSLRDWTDLVQAEWAILRALLTVAFRSRGALLACDAAMANPLSVDSIQRAHELEVAVSRAVRYGPLRPKCLAKSVALHRLLDRSGIPGSRIRIGVRRVADDLVAHAWVTLGGTILGDDPAFVGRFTEIADTQMPGLA